MFLFFGYYRYAKANGAPPFYHMINNFFQNEAGKILTSMSLLSEKKLRKKKSKKTRTIDEQLDKLWMEYREGSVSVWELLEKAGRVVTVG